MLAANIRTGTERMNRPIVRLIPLKISAQDQDSDSNKLNCKHNSANSMSNSQPDNASTITEPCPVRNSVKKALENLTQWADVLLRLVSLFFTMYSNKKNRLHTCDLHKHSTTL